MDLGGKINDFYATPETKASEFTPENRPNVV